MMKKTESDVLTLQLPLIDEDCESGDTNKSVHFDEKIKQDVDRMKTVVFKRFSIKDIKKPQNVTSIIKKKPSFINDNFCDDIQ